MDKDTNKPPKKPLLTNLQGRGPIHIIRDESTGKLGLRGKGSIIDIIDPGGAEERSRARIRQADAAQKRSEQRSEMFEEIAKEIINPEIKSKWQDKIRQAIKYFEDKKLDTALWDYFIEAKRDEDPLRNINVIYLLLAMAHDDHLQMNFIITDELKKTNPALFCSGNTMFYLVSGARLPLFWEHIKRDLNIGIDLASTKQNGKKGKSQPEKPSAKAQVLATLIEHPDWSNTKIAETAGISRTTLYDYPEFKAARKTQKQNKGKIPRGSKSQDGTIEAIDE
jgi:hypothetical protein